MKRNNEQLLFAVFSKNHFNMQILTYSNSPSATLAFQTFVQKRNKVIAKKSPYSKNPPVHNRAGLAQYCKRDI